MSRSIQITFDAADPHALAAWWAELLGYEVESNHEMIAGLLEQGIVSEDDVVRVDGTLFFADAVAIDGDGPRMLFQRVPEPKMAKNRVHLDLPVDPDELESEVDRVVATGGTFVDYRSHPGHRWAVMQDPEGNEFCLH